MKYCPSCLKCFEEAFELCADDQSILVESPPRALVLAGKYRIDRLISRGPNAVYEGTQIKTERPVAIKLILADADAAERLRQKALAVACICTRVDHQHVVKTCDYGHLSGGIAYVVTELVDGPTLRAHLDAHGRMAPAEAARIARQVADGLAAAHASGVVHGGLNPSNVILARDYHGRPDAKVFNFGLSECQGQSPGGVSPTASPDEARSYLSPEQLSGRGADARSDLYSLGVVLHEMLTAQASCARRAAPPDPEPLEGERLAHTETCCGQAPEPLLALLSDVLNEKPSSRLQCAAEFARRLRLIECPEITLTPGVPGPVPSASDSETNSGLTEPVLPPGCDASVPPNPSAKPPVRKLGLLDDYADDLPIRHARPLGTRPPRVADDAASHVEHGAALAPGRRQRPSQYESRGPSARPDAPAPPTTISPGPQQTHAHHLFAVAVPTLLVLALGAFGWLVSRTTHPPATNTAATRSPVSASQLTLSRRPDPSAADETEAREAAVPSAADDGQRSKARDELPRPRGETRKRVGSSAPEAEVITTAQEVPNNGAPTPAAPVRERAGDERCKLETSTGTLILQGDGGSGVVAVSLHNGPAGSAAVTATTQDWSDIAVLAASPGNAAAGGSVYRIVAVSKRAGSYDVKFNSPCGAQRVLVKVE